MSILSPTRYFPNYHCILQQTTFLSYESTECSPLTQPIVSLCGRLPRNSSKKSRAQPPQENAEGKLRSYELNAREKSCNQKKHQKENVLAIMKNVIKDHSGVFSWHVAMLFGKKKMYCRHGKL